MQRTGSILKRFIKDYGLEAGLTFTTVKDQWAKLVGNTIAAHTCPDTVKNGTIFIIVDTPQWMHHLSFYKQEICLKLSRFNITEVRFRLGKLPEGEESHKTGGRGISEVELTEDDKRFIENTVRSIKDDDLKKKFTDLITHSLKRKRI